MLGDEYYKRLQLRIKNPAGTSNTYWFPIKAPPSSLPHLTSLTPDRGTFNTSVTITGKNLKFVRGVSFFDEQNRGAMSIRFYADQNTLGNIIPVICSPYVSDTQIRFFIPKNDRLFKPGSTNHLHVAVYTKSGVLGNELPFTLTIQSKAAQ